MMEKTKLVFKDDVMNGYVHYINFKRNFNGALEVFKKYILPTECKIAIDANADYLIIYVIHDENIWDELTSFLKDEGIQFSYPSAYEDSIVISIDEFVEWVLKKYILELEK